MHAIPLMPAITLPFLNDIVVLLAIAVVVATLCYRLHIPPIAGFLIAGVLIGPSVLGVIAERELIDILAEIGVILLLFTIGVEFSLQRLARLGRVIFVAGGTQVLLTIAAVTGLLAVFGVDLPAGIYTGLLVSLSSTAIVLGILADRDEIGTPAGGLTLSFLIFQDLAVVLMVFLLPILAGGGEGPVSVLIVVARAMAVIGLTLVLARMAVPWILERVAATGRSELFLLTIVVLCLGMAALASFFGVSLALGAFLAGLVVSESRYRDQALSDVIPLRVVFNAVFFASVGMLLDMSFVLSRPLMILGIAAAAILLKFALGMLGGLAVRFPVRIAAVSAASIAQVGEFSFVLERAGAVIGLSPAGLGETGQQVFIASTVLLMILTPFMMSAGPKIGDFLQRFARRRENEEDYTDGETPQLEDHVVIIGFGHAGRHLVRVFSETEIPYLVVEMNPRLVSELTDRNVPLVIGDAVGRHILEVAGIERAKIAAVVINDDSAALRIVSTIRYMNPTVQIVVRTRHVQRVEPLHDAGADIVIPDELETTARIYAHILGAYMIPPDEIDQHLQTLRAHDYEILRGSIQEAHLMVLKGLDEDGLHTRAVAVRPGAPAAGKTLAELALRREHAITVLAIRRGRQTIASPDGSFRVEAGDRLVLIGLAEQFAACGHLFRDAIAPPPAAD